MRDTSLPLNELAMDGVLLSQVIPTVRPVLFDRIQASGSSGCRIRTYGLLDMSQVGCRFPNPQCYKWLTPAGFKPATFLSPHPVSGGHPVHSLFYPHERSATELRGHVVCQHYIRFGWLWTLPRRSIAGTYSTEPTKRLELLFPAYKAGFLATGRCRLISDFFNC